VKLSWMSTENDLSDVSLKDPSNEDEFARLVDGKFERVSREVEAVGIAAVGIVSTSPFYLSAFF
jgi:hypothetical protein